jgi:hypothetical protein
MVFVRRQRALADPLIDLRLCRMPGFRGFGPTRTRSVADPTSEAPAATDRNEQSNALDDVARKPAAWAANHRRANRADRLLRAGGFPLTAALIAITVTGLYWYSEAPRLVLIGNLPHDLGGGGLTCSRC